MFRGTALYFLAFNTLLALAAQRENIKLNLEGTFSCLAIQDVLEGDKGESLSVYPCERDSRSKWDIDLDEGGPITLSGTSLEVKTIVTDGVYVKVALDELNDDKWQFASDGKIRYIANDLTPWGGIEQCLGQPPKLKNGMTANIGLVDCTDADSQQGKLLFF
ncbi:uncharacterized protein L199_008694 [Kwoniella botswanensis]|uniref:uncharacterized protein n=1 Tax=Kwoniella botswanensis TaxID=1268659 RepID=UPI00315DDA24